MKTPEEYRAEAVRLLSLDEEGQRVEMLAKSLRLMDMHADADEQLNQLDMHFFRETAGAGNEEDQHVSGSGGISHEAEEPDA